MANIKNVQFEPVSKKKKKNRRSGQGFPKGWRVSHKSRAFFTALNSSAELRSSLPSPGHAVPHHRSPHGSITQTPVPTLCPLLQSQASLLQPGVEVDADSAWAVTRGRSGMVSQSKNEQEVEPHRKPPNAPQLSRSQEGWRKEKTIPFPILLAACSLNTNLNDDFSISPTKKKERSPREPPPCLQNSFSHQISTSSA